MNDLIKVKYEETSNFVTKKNNIKKKKNREKMADYAKKIKI